MGDLTAGGGHACAKCERPEVRFHGVKCALNRGRNEIDNLTSDLDRARRQIVRLQLQLQRQNRRQNIDEAEEAAEDEDKYSLASESTTTVYDAKRGDRRPAGLIRRFGDLYSTARLETLDELDAIPDLIDAAELKNKLLFSVIVVSAFKLKRKKNERGLYINFISSTKMYVTKKELISWMSVGFSAPDQMYVCRRCDFIVEFLCQSKVTLACFELIHL